MKMVMLGMLVFAFLTIPARVVAHSGRTDSSGGHNCNVGSCAGTYHYHNGGGYTSTPPPKPVVKTQTTTETEAIQFQTIEQNNSDLAIGRTRTTQEGSTGIKTNTYKITYIDGVQTSKQLLSSAIIKSPINRVVAVGTKTEPSVAAASITKPPENDESASNGEALGGLAVLSGIGYGVFKLCRLGLSRLKGD
jgi:resuscitation-promoting factor RpfB